MEKLQSISHPVVIFDGVCNLCNNTVDFLIRRDRKQLYRFTANQDTTGRALLEAQGVNPDDVSTIYLWENGRLYTRSTAVLRILRRLPFPWPLFYAGIVIPPFIRNGIYRWVARNRYRWYGRRNTCRVPTPEERARFLN